MTSNTLFIMDHSQKFKRDKSMYKGILFSLKRKGKSDTGYTVDEPRGHCAQGNKRVTKGQIL